MSKGSQQRPTDAEKYGANFDRIFRNLSRKPVDAGQHKDCGFPFCDCAKKCEKKT